MTTRRAHRLHRVATTARFALSRAVLAFAALAILFGVLRGGTRFFYCPMTHLAFDEPPCAAPRGEADDTDGPHLQASECCVEKWRAVVPAASAAAAIDTTVPPASVGAVIPPALFDITTRSATVPFRFSHGVRAGPPPLASERRAQLMIFNI